MFTYFCVVLDIKIGLREPEPNTLNKKVQFLPDSKQPTPSQPRKPEAMPVHFAVYRQFM